VLGAALVLALALLALWLVLDAVRLGIGPMPSGPRAVGAVLELLPGDLTGEIHELGSGWGGLARALARARPGSRVEASELAWVPHLASRLLALPGPANLRLHRRDLLSAPLGQAGVVVCYLYPAAMARLRPKLESELRPGAVVISHAFAVPGWTPAEVRELGDLWHTRVYLYRR
jgi:hypothetical protein